MKIRHFSTLKSGLFAEIVVVMCRNTTRNNSRAEESAVTYNKL